MKLSGKEQKKIGWGIIGIGDHVKERLAPALKKAASSRIIAVCSRNMERATAFARENDIDLAFDSPEKMLANPDIDAVCIATPNNLHVSQAIMAANCGKHVLCEKPMALNEADGERMIKTFDKNKVKLGVVFQNRYHPAHVEAHQLVLSGNTGQIPLVKAQYCNTMLKFVLQKGWRSDPSAAGAGALVATALHPIDVVRFILGSEIVEVFAYCQPEPTATTVEEMVYTLFKLDNGTTAIVTSGVLPYSDNDLVIYGYNARITCKNTIGMKLQGELLVEGGKENIKKAFPSEQPISAMYVSLIEAFNNCINADTVPEVSGYEGLRMIKVADAALKSSRLGKAIKISK